MEGSKVIMQETKAEDVLKVMRNDNKKLDDALDELEQLRADLRKAGELITNAVIESIVPALGLKPARYCSEFKPTDKVHGI